MYDKMDISKYDGNVHPDEWINDIQKYYSLWENHYGGFLKTAISLVDSTIKLPTEIYDIEKLRNALKEDISFTIFKNTNEIKLQLLKYNPEREGGDTSKFISTFRKLCYNAEINDLKEQKKYLYKSLPNNHLDYISNEFFKKMENVKSINDLIKEFGKIILEESNLIRDESIVALKHVATGKYLSSIKDLCYTTGTNYQMVFAGNSEPDPNSLWKIEFDKAYSDTSIKLQHIKSSDNKFLGIYFGHNYYDDNSNFIYDYFKSPSANHTEVSCNNKSNVGNESYWIENWNFNHIKKNRQEYLKSNDIINLSIKKTRDYRGHFTTDGDYEFLRSHDIQFTIDDDTFQEVVVCHSRDSGRLGGNDEWCIELIHEGKIS